MKSLRFILLLAALAGCSPAAQASEPEAIVRFRNALLSLTASGDTCSAEIIASEGSKYIIETKCAKLPRICYVGIDVSDAEPIETLELLGCKPKPEVKEI